jgi:5-methylcytosine-specific restriction endonuclease McrA
MPTQLQRSRHLAFVQQGGKCIYCEMPMWLNAPEGAKPLRCTAEHLIPRSEGGSDGPGNIVAACAKCNHTRHRQKTPPQPMAYKARVWTRMKQGRWHAQSVLVAATKRTASTEDSR